MFTCTLHQCITAHTRNNTNQDERAYTEKHVDDIARNIQLGSNLHKMLTKHRGACVKCHIIKKGDMDGTRVSHQSTYRGKNLQIVTLLVHLAHQVQLKHAKKSNMHKGLGTK